MISPMILVICIPLFFFLPGYIFMLIFNKIEAEIRIMLSFGISAILFAILSFFGIIIKEVIVLSFLCLLTLFFLFYRRIKIIKQDITYVFKNYIFWAFLVFYLVNILFLFFIPYFQGYGYYGDWNLHYSLAEAFANGNSISNNWTMYGYNIASRTPMFNMTSAFFLQIFGKNFWVFQIVSVFLNTLFFLPAYFIIKKIINGRVAKVTSLFFFFSVPILVNTTYTWPKLFACYFILIGMLYYLKHKINKRSSHLIVFSIFSGFAFLVHQYTVFYFFAIVLYECMMHLKHKKNLIKLLLRLFIICSTFLFIISPWYIYLLSSLGIQKVLSSTVTIINTDSILHFGKASSAAINLLSQFVPIMVGYGLAFPFISSLITTPTEYSGYFGRIFEYLTATYIQNYFFAISLTLSLLILINYKKFFTLFRNNKYSRLLLTIFCVSFVCSALTNGLPAWAGLVSTTMLPSLLLLLGLVGEFVISSKISKILLILFMSETVIFYFVPKIIIFSGGNWVLTKGNLLLKIQNNLLFFSDLFKDSIVVVIAGICLIFIYAFLAVYLIKDLSTDRWQMLYEKQISFCNKFH